MSPRVRLFMSAVVIPQKRPREADEQLEARETKRPMLARYLSPQKSTATPNSSKPREKSRTPQSVRTARLSHGSSPGSIGLSQSVLSFKPKVQRQPTPPSNSEIIDLSLSPTPLTQPRPVTPKTIPDPVKRELAVHPSPSPQSPTPRARTRREEDPPLLPGPILLPLIPQTDYSEIRPSSYISAEEQRRRARNYATYQRENLLNYSDYFTKAKITVDPRHWPPNGGKVEFKYFRSHFHFLREGKSMYGSGVHAPDKGFDTSCACSQTQGQGCTAFNTSVNSECECFEETVHGTAVAGIFPYTLDGRLQDQWLRCPQSLVIQECNDDCDCGEYCGNKVSQRPRDFPVRIFYTGDARKWGLKTEQALPRGRFVDQYVGEIIAHQEIVLAEERALVRNESFLFDLGHFKHNDPKRPWPDRELYAMNSDFWGNCTAFINHSCEPNLRCYVVRETQDERIYRLCFFALRDISAGEELTFDYAHGGSTQIKRGRKTGTAMEDGGLSCHCGSAKCRGILWG